MKVKRVSGLAYTSDRLELGINDETGRTVFFEVTPSILAAMHKAYAEAKADRTPNMMGFATVDV